MTVSVLRFFLHDPATPEIYTLSLHDALPISAAARRGSAARWTGRAPARRCNGPPGRPARGTSPGPGNTPRSEEHTSELQSRRDLVCRLLLEKKNISTI